VKSLLESLPHELRVHALTHPAFAAQRDESFERLEFLGDSVLDLVITEAIYLRYPDLAEGELSRIRASVVSRASCAVVGEANGLGAAMVDIAAAHGTTQGATAARLAPQRNALAALVESTIGAGFLAHGYDEIAPRVVAAFEERIRHACENRIDAKSQLQELASRDGADVTYEAVGEEGPPHDRRFTMTARVGHLSANGTGRSKQEAQQEAAASLLAVLEQEQG
jgi:ribonuclease-3